MANDKPQSYENHARWVPLYHFGISTILLVNFVWALYLMIKGPSWAAAMSVLMAFSFLGMLYYLREFALTVQDRVIRLEMRLKLQELLAGDLKPRIGELSPAQLIGLRFASDSELPGLVREILDRKLTTPREIKRRIQNWQADHFRA